MTYRTSFYLEFISDSTSPLVFSLHILQLSEQLLSGQLGGGQLLLRVGGQQLAQLAELLPGGGVQLPGRAAGLLQLRPELLNIISFDKRSFQSEELLVNNINSFSLGILI